MVMCQFPVSYEGEVGKEMTYEPSKFVLTAVLYVIPVGLVKEALTLYT